MGQHRRDFLKTATAAALAATFRSPVSAAVQNLGIPGPYPGRVIALHSPNIISGGAYQNQTVQQVMRRGMTELTGAPAWQDAWRSFFEKGDVVGIKVCPVGGPNLSSDATVLHEIIAGLEQAGIPHKDIVVFNRYRKETEDAGITKWIPQGVRFEWASEAYNRIQLDMEGYDPEHYMEMALVQPGQDVRDEHLRRSYVAKIVTQRVNKIINLPILKHHQSAGITIALKNMSHGFVNNVNRSHSTVTLNACGSFIPAVVNLPIIRQKVVLHIVDGVKASYHGGPGGRPRYIWEHKTMYFGTDPVAVDKTGWQAIEAKRAEVGMDPIVYAKPDRDSTYVHGQVEHIEIASALGLGVFDDKKLQVKRIEIA